MGEEANEFPHLFFAKKQEEKIMAIKKYKLVLEKHSLFNSEWNKHMKKTPLLDGSLPFKPYLGSTKRFGNWALITYIVGDDGNDREKPFARIVSFQDETGKELTDEEVEKILKSEYSIDVCDLGEDGGKAELNVTCEEVSPTGGIVLTPEILEVVQRRAKEGRLSEDDLSERARAMIRGGVPKPFVVTVLESVDITRESMRRPTEYVDPELDLTKKRHEPSLLYRALSSFLMGYAKILKGPKSTGKNTFINWVTWIMNVPQTEHTATLQDSRADYMASEVTDNTAVETLRHMKAELLAKKMVITIKALLMSIVSVVTLGIVKLELSDDDKEALAQLFLYDRAKAEAASVHIVYEYAALAKWILQGGVFVLNEANMADANLLVGLLHPILDGSITSFPIPGVGDVKLGKNLVLYMTMNPGYVGEQDMNDATKSRLGAYELAQPNSIRKLLEKAVEHELENYGISEPLDESVYDAAVKFYDKVNETVKKGEKDLSDSALNIRGMVRALATYGRFKDMPGVKVSTFLKDEVVTPCDSQEERMVLESILRAMVNC